MDKILVDNFKTINLALMLVRAAGTGPACSIAGAAAGTCPQCMLYAGAGGWTCSSIHALMLVRAAGTGPQCIL